MKSKELGALGKGLRALWEQNKFVLLVIAAGAALLLLPALSGGSGAAGESAAAAGEEADAFQVEALEKRMEEALSRITGVGEVRVVLTLQSSPRRILAQDTQRTVEADSTDAALTTVVLSGGGTEETVTLQQISPQYQGALVVCSGGGNPSVRLQVVEAVSALTGLGADHISVCEGK